MATKNVTFIFDRLENATKTGRGKVEIRVYLNRNVRKYIVVGETTKNGWKTYQNSQDLRAQLAAPTLKGITFFKEFRKPFTTGAYANFAKEKY